MIFTATTQGSYVVLAAETGSDVGVDVMDVRPVSRGQTVTQYFALMRRQFTENEWLSVCRPLDDDDKLVRDHVSSSNPSVVMLVTAAVLSALVSQRVVHQSHRGGPWT